MLKAKKTPINKFHNFCTIGQEPGLTRIPIEDR